MTSVIEPSPTHPLQAERQRVLDDLNLSMLFLETARVDTAPTVEGAEDVDDRWSDAARRLHVRVLARRPLTPAATAALLCRVLHNRRIPGIEIDHIAEGVRLRCAYLLPSGRWRIDITAPLA
ncbi:MAG: hypothetical protein ABW091_10330 [Microbacterium sp.]